MQKLTYQGLIIGEITENKSRSRWATFSIRISNEYLANVAIKEAEIHRFVTPNLFNIENGHLSYDGNIYTNKKGIDAIMNVLNLTELKF